MRLIVLHSTFITYEGNEIFEFFVFVDGGEVVRETGFLFPLFKSFVSLDYIIRWLLARL